MLLPEAYNKVFNVGADKPYTINELADVVCRHFQVDPDMSYLPARAEVMHAFSDHSKARGVFGDPSTITLDDGIKRMAEWAKKTGSRKGQEFKNIEIREKMPAGW